MSKLLTLGIWKEITKQTKRKPSGCHVAVPYFSDGAGRMLPLREGSTLIVDMSKSTVGSGLTMPSEVLKLIKRGVDVQSVENLHAKVFVIGNRAYIGSTNVSKNSAENLVEAAIMTSEIPVVKACRRFVDSLRGELITPEFAKRMQKLYKPPKFGPGRKGGRTTGILHSPLWLVPLEYIEWDETDEAAREEGLPRAKAELRSERNFRIENFCWLGSDLDRLHKDDLVIQILKDGRKKLVYPTSRVLPIRRYRVRSSRRAIVYLETARNLRAKNLKSVLTRLGTTPKRFRKLASPWMPRDRKFIHDLVNLWPVRKAA